MNATVSHEMRNPINSLQVHNKELQFSILRLDESVNALKCTNIDKSRKKMIGLLE